jgi:integrase
VVNYEPPEPDFESGYLPPSARFMDVYGSGFFRYNRKLSEKHRKAQAPMPLFAESIVWMLMFLLCRICGRHIHHSGWEKQQAKSAPLIVTQANAGATAGVPTALFHDLRRTALTNMIEAGFSEKEAMEIGGHRTRYVFDRYHIVSDRRQAEESR